MKVVINPDKKLIRISVVRSPADSWSLKFLLYRWSDSLNLLFLEGTIILSKNDRDEEQSFLFHSNCNVMCT